MTVLRILVLLLLLPFMLLGGLYACALAGFTIGKGFIVEAFMDLFQ